jgi:hypothetical protein
MNFDNKITLVPFDCETFFRFSSLSAHFAVFSVRI